MRIIGNDPSTPRQAQIVASGTLSTGDTVVVNADGTVSVVEGVAGGAGSSAVFESAAIYNTAATFDSNSNKVVVAYRDGGNSFYGTAVVGTVSGTSISFGAPVVFVSTNVYPISATFDSNSNKIVLSYQDRGNSFYGTSIVGTVSGTSISFGTPVVFESAETTGISSTFDSNSNKVVISYRDVGNNTGRGTSVVGTVSGTSISFGTPVVFETGVVSQNSSVFDANSNKVVIAYKDDDSSGAGTAIVGTVSGTSISFGSAVVFNSSATEVISASFDSNSNKIVIAYQDQGNSSYGTAVVGGVSGTSISFGAPVVFNQATTLYISAVFDSTANSVVVSYRDVGNISYGTVITGKVSGTAITFGSEAVFESATTLEIASTFDSSSGKVVIAYSDFGNSSYGTSVVFSSPTTNLTASNYIGTAATGAADTQRAKINLKGAVDENQSGLTAGQSYYVQTDGTLGTTPADPSVFAGTAVAATKLIVKG